MCVCLIICVQKLDLPSKHVYLYIFLNVVCALIMDYYWQLCHISLSNSLWLGETGNQFAYEIIFGIFLVHALYSDQLLCPSILFSVSDYSYQLGNK